MEAAEIDKRQQSADFNIKITVFFAYFMCWVGLGIQRMLFIVADMRLCFGFMLKTVLITQIFPVHLLNCLYHNP